jgi:hypothetical protein
MLICGKSKERKIILYEITLDSVVRKLLDIVVRLAENPHLESLAPETA